MNDATVWGAAFPSSSILMSPQVVWSVASHVLPSARLGSGGAFVCGGLVTAGGAVSQLTSPTLAGLGLATRGPEPVVALSFLLSS